MSQGKDQKQKRFEHVKLGQNFLMSDIRNTNKSHWYRKQTTTTAIRAVDNKVAVIYPKELIVALGQGVPSVPFMTINNKNLKVVLLESKRHHWQEMSMVEAELYIATNNLSPLTPAYQVRGKR